MPDILPRRRILLASATTLPLLLATAGCRSSDVFTGPDPLAGRPRPAPGVITLQAVIAAEEELISLYRTALAGDTRAARSAVAKTLLTQHEQHLAQLRARLVQPPGTASAQAPARPSAASRPSASTSAGTPAGTASPAPVRVTIARLRAAEGASAASLVQRLATVEPGLAQLFASIAASDATHVAALGG
ncbi:MAG: hypothetical protein M3Z75_28095 [Actinomycetota bacterium]|nr:hypothetical protein [Actinomycetota bacterium]